MTREEFEAIIQAINDAKLDSVHAVEDVRAFAQIGKCVASGLNVDKHR